MSANTTGQQPVSNVLPTSNLQPTAAATPPPSSLPPLPSSVPPKPIEGNPIDASKYLNRPNVARLRGQTPQIVAQQIAQLQRQMKTQDATRAGLQAQLSTTPAAAQQLPLIGQLIPMTQRVINMRDDVIGMYLLTGQNPQDELTTNHAARVLTLDANLSQLRLEQQRLGGIAQPAATGQAGTPGLVAHQLIATQLPAGAQRAAAGNGGSNAPVFPSPQKVGAAGATLSGSAGAAPVSSTGQAPSQGTDAPAPL
ncbi:hypothetical protein LTR10_015517 [Elasticomyces elasticus]|uniref:Uncharacterized protein n=1 Tax=Exophiala sideris TaxID=1016849 RepID=A0ABR0J434_9EURO|nr:hypothetical protein LTR10_015517 [Elasticomyces elasticus]KAK5026891.1 hypothetical protein LTS07_007190 [Exophiala sideris]KAK5033895.1 hypothetical protein LTR13_006495 [Exophiala sideris]KAK5055830.1 hypothetical protein LTR69_008205 [Exophiala sideris]KAK5180837.1 hypothetical protein LTR44_006657 [Eurotiomycetes sp. CCFEE 6388]